MSVSSAFEKVGECLYRYKPTGGFYARIKMTGKEIRRSLRTADRALAKRRLADLHRDLTRIAPDAAKVCLADLCDRYLKTVAHQKPKTVRRKMDIVRRIKADWPGGAQIAASRVVPSQILTWLASYDFGPPSYSLYLDCVRAVFDLAVGDRLIATSPVTGLRGLKREQPVRQTPSFEEFRAIVDDIRAQVFNADAQGSADFIEFMGLAGLGQAETGHSSEATSTGQKHKLPRFGTRPVKGS